MDGENGASVNVLRHVERVLGQKVEPKQYQQCAGVKNVLGLLLTWKAAMNYHVVSRRDYK